MGIVDKIFIKCNATLYFIYAELMGVRVNAFLKKRSFLEFSALLLNRQENVEKQSFVLKNVPKSCIEELISSHEPCSGHVYKEDIQELKHDLKVKWPTSKRREKAVNTDFTFQPNTKVQFVSPKDSAVVSDEFSDTESDATVDNESDQPYNPEETSESD